MSKSLYSILEVSENATPEEIKKSYRRLARKYHPDINKEPGAEAKFKEINGAYEILSNEQKRAQYDSYGDSIFGGQNFEDVMRNNQSSEILNSIFENIFSGRFSTFASGFSPGDTFGFSHQRPNQHLSADIEIDFKKAIDGGDVEINIAGQRRHLSIPAGVNDGTILRVSGEKFGIANTLHIKIKVVNNDPTIIRRGNDLIKTVTIPLKTLIFGGDIKIDRLGKEIVANIPANTDATKVVRLKGLGVKNGSGEAGNLLLKISVKLPDFSKFDDKLLQDLKKYL